MRKLLLLAVITLLTGLLYIGDVSANELNGTRLTSNYTETGLTEIQTKYRQKGKSSPLKLKPRKKSKPKFNKDTKKGSRFNKKYR